MRISPVGSVNKVYKKVHFLKHIKKIEILLNKFKKTLDKPKYIWYNIINKAKHQ